MRSAATPDRRAPAGLQVLHFAAALAELRREDAEQKAEEEDEKKTLRAQVEQLQRQVVRQQRLLDVYAAQAAGAGAAAPPWIRSVAVTDLRSAQVAGAVQTVVVGGGHREELALCCLARYLVAEEEEKDDGGSSDVERHQLVAHSRMGLQRWFELRREARRSLAWLVDEVARRVPQVNEAVLEVRVKLLVERLRTVVDLPKSVWLDDDVDEALCLLAHSLVRSLHWPRGRARYQLYRATAWAALVRLCTRAYVRAPVLTTLLWGVARAHPLPDLTATADHDDDPLVP